jgi:hypothetical protein
MLTKSGYISFNLDIEDNNLSVEEWISKYYPDSAACTNKCNIAVQELVAAFPELSVQVGFANGVPHCWAITNDGSIIDPTIKQFKLPVSYTIWCNGLADRGDFS